MSHPWVLEVHEDPTIALRRHEPVGPLAGAQLLRRHRGDALEVAQQRGLAAAPLTDDRGVLQRLAPPQIEQTPDLPFTAKEMARVCHRWAGDKRGRLPILNQKVI